jgi:hypothetical protein
LGIRKEFHPDLYRKGAQYIGTDLVREEYPDWWVMLFARECERVKDIRSGVIVDDMRFENEYDWCVNNGFFVIRLDITPEEQIARGAEAHTFWHSSETGLDHLAPEAFDLWLSQDTSPAQRVILVMNALQNYQSFPTRIG